MSNEELKDLCREAWKEDYNFLLIDRLKKHKEKYCMLIESRCRKMLLSASRSILLYRLFMLDYKNLGTLYFQTVFRSLSIVAVESG